MWVLGCKEFTQERRELARNLEGAKKCSEEFEGGEELGKVALLLGRRVEDVDREVMGVIDGWLLKELLVWWKRRKELLGWL